MKNLYSARNISPIKVTSTGQQFGNYTKLQSGTWRHENSAGAPSAGTPSALTANNYLLQTLARFKRSFSTTVADVPPTPNGSNNYTSTAYFNGSRIEDFTCTIRLKNNTSARTVYLDIFEVALSFFDCLQWQTQYPSNAPFTMDTVVSSVNAGEITGVTPAQGTITMLAYNNFTGLKHFLRRVGTVTLNGADTPDNTCEILINRVPPNCRRSQNGMNWAYIIFNDQNKNGSTQLDLSYNVDFSSTEIPSDNRLPYQN